MKVEIIKDGTMVIQPETWAEDKRLTDWYKEHGKAKCNTVIDFRRKSDLDTKQPDLPAPNTVMWWLCRIADPEIRRKAVQLCEPKQYHIEYSDLGEAIGWAFIWPQPFWSTVHLDPLLPEPEFKEYLELRKL